MRSIPLHLFSVVAFVEIVSLFSCSDVTTITTPTNDSLVIKTIQFVPDSSSGYYFSFDSGTSLVVEKETETIWDMVVKPVFGGGRTTRIDVLFNSGSVNEAGTTKAYVVDTTFDNVSVWSVSALRGDSSSTSGRIASVDLSGKGLFNYDPVNRTIAPNPFKTIIVRSKGGSVYKLQFVTLTVPQSRSELGAFTMRYAKAVGTRLK